MIKKTPSPVPNPTLTPASSSALTSQKPALWHRLARGQCAAPTPREARRAISWGAMLTQCATMLCLVKKKKFFEIVCLKKNVKKKIWLNCSGGGGMVWLGEQKNKYPLKKPTAEKASTLEKS